ncbi:putative bifunctional diguanylate cyclase/phosphodiesterase [Polymorphobacter fuscus]|uniref:EAL domain-containing protein n=1 Tax=Sandarakinorhabdus fusca TaxID=1439888 RepID=A0A7C9GT07_9SPHN|nr:EAL domain-containing protein [Polymorphobacter fuscus]KAB7644354.1 EAL domain-containing protein [Polymorphobacter fuscus]MQT18271.1 EAL domain-containing protein [Polymorphobacter fuscus]NJC08165.1 diguanylate cyclase (GGDEF)-like protein/PAS domain S-box-containing protein [Polymorphobacter fuscus]
MTAIFKPPIAAGTAVGWHQVFGFGQGDDPFFAQVRAAQLHALNRYVPFNVALMIVNVVALLFSFNGVAEHDFRIAWGLVMAGLALLWTLRFLTIRRRGEIAVAGAALFWAITAEVVAFGACWAAMLAHLMPAADLDKQALLLLLSLTAMGACGFAAAVMPVCAIALVVIIGGGALLAMPAGSALLSPAVVLAFVTFALLIVRGVIVTSFSMMARMRTQIELGDRNEVVRLLLNEFEANGSDWLIEVDHEGRLTHVSPRLADVARRPRSDLLGQPLLGLLGRDRQGEARAAIRTLTTTFEARRGFRDITVPVDVGGETRWWALSGTPKFDSAGMFTGYRGVGRDVTEARRSHERIAQLARFDPLTGLANRALFREALEDALARAVRTGKSCALLFIDLDRFKAVNDTLGHSAGDRLLRETAGRLRDAIGGGATIARLGGDEFAVMLPDCSARRVDHVARAIVATLAQPFPLDGASATIGASVGYALGPSDGGSVDKLLKSADLALYEVKSNGRGAACRFIPAIRDKAEERRALEADLAQALARGELSLAFQPVVEASDEHIVGFEALLRWNHPAHGKVPPDKFIPVAEATGLIIPIGHWVIRNACAWAARWPDHVRVAVNLSPAQIEDPLLIETVQRALADNDLDPARLELEITESLFLNEKPATTAKLAALRGLGVSFALDDFGTGYSSLGYLHKAAFSRIKIDRSFVSRAVQPGSEAGAIIQAIVSLAHSLDMATTAEGTETREEFEFCRALGCEQIQGYLFGRPMPPEEATALVRPATRLRLVAE